MSEIVYDGDVYDGSTVHMLTTRDNPYSPFTQFLEWYAFDNMHGYNTSGMLAMFTITSDELSNFDQDLAIELAMNEIIEEDVVGLYKKVTREDYKQ